MTKAIPDGLHTITPQLVVSDCAKAIDWYKKAFGAEEQQRVPDPSGAKIWHASLRVGSSMFFCNDEFPGMSDAGKKVALHLYTEHVDAAWKRAIDAGASVKMPMIDMFWGDRTGTLTDPFGHQWTLAQHTKDMSPAEMKKAQDDFVASMKK